MQTASGKSIPPQVETAITDWAEDHRVPLPTVEYDCIMGCFYYWHSGVFYGVEMDGYIHT